MGPNAPRHKRGWEQLLDNEICKDAQHMADVENWKLQFCTPPPFRGEDYLPALIRFN